MFLHYYQIILIFIQTYTFIITFTNSNERIFRKLNETNSTEEIDINSIDIIDINSTEEIDINSTYLIDTNSTEEIDINSTDLIDVNSTEEIERNITEMDCLSLLDCFNCTLNQYCRWNWSNNSCDLYEPYNKNYTIPPLKKLYIQNDIEVLNPHINFIRKVCFLPFIPYSENNNSLLYNNISVKHCGPHYIKTSPEKYSKDFIIQLNNINGIYGLPNILCEYIILSGPNWFETNIEINENEKENFYLLYSENSHYFSEHINESTTLTISNTGRKANTFIYYGLKSFNSPPFKITFKENPSQNDSQTTGYIFIGLIIAIFILVVTSTIYIRLNSKLFKNHKKKISEEEEEKIRTKSDYSMDCIDKKDNLNALENKPQNQKSEIIDKSDPLTPDNLLSKKNMIHFSFDNIKINKLNEINELSKCCFDNQLIYNQNEIYKARCGHIYHLQCFNLLLDNNYRYTGQLGLRCISCSNIIYP